MSIQCGPKSFGKLNLGTKIHNIQVHHNQDLIVLSTHKQTLQCHYLKNSKTTSPSTLLKLKQLPIDQNPQLFAITNSHILHCQDDKLKIDNRYQLKNEGIVKNLLVDSENIALTSCKNRIRINNIGGNKVEGELKGRDGEDVRSIFWNNSLVISGDNGGVLNVWDINKQHSVHSKSISKSPIALINVYTDFIHTNVYYTLSKIDKRIQFFDLRAYDKIGIIQNLPKSTIAINHNKSGKIFIMSQRQLTFLDLYKGYNLIGNFTQVKPQFQHTFQSQHPNSQPYYRNLLDMLIWDKYVLLGCSNGCIEVYNTDLYQCIYSFGMGQYSGVKKLVRMGGHLICLEENGDMEIARMI